MSAEPLFHLERDWEVTTLGDVAARGGGSIQTGPFGSQLHASDYVDHGIPSIMPQNITTDRISEEGIARITEEDAERLPKYRVRTGDIVYSRRGDVERRALVREENNGWLCGTGCLKVDLGEGVVIPEYAAFYLSHPASKAWVVQHAVGATMPNLNTSILSALPFVLPSIKEQEQIANALTALDDKIELNRQMNETLEEMARELFRDWFVDFGPTRRKIAGETDPVKILGSAIQDPQKAGSIAALFPNTLGDDGLPVGWRNAELRDALTLNYGKALIKKQRIAGNYAVYGSGGPSGTHNSALAKGPSIIVGRKGTVGSLYWTPDDFYAIDTVFYVTSDLPMVFCHRLLETLGLEGLNTDAAVPGLNRNNAYGQEFAFGGQRLVEAHASVAEKLVEKTDANVVENQTLADLRDLLLPKLMSGEIRLKDAGGET